LSERCLEGPAPVNVSMVKITWFLCRRQHIWTRRNNGDWHPRCWRLPRRVFFTAGHLPHPPIVTILYYCSSKHTTSFSLHKKKQIRTQQKVHKFLKRKLQFLQIWHCSLCDLFSVSFPKVKVCLTGSCNFASYSSCKISHETDISSILPAIIHIKCFKNS
jgi:transcription elongation factor Elf1